MFRSKQLLAATAVLALGTASAQGATLMHHWTFDTNGLDAVGAAHATLESGTAIVAGGQFGNALSVPDAAAGAVVGASDAPVLPTTNFTFTAWVNQDVNNTESFGTIMGNQSGGSAAGAFLRADTEGSDGDLFGRVNNGPGATAEAGTIDAGQWTHVAMTVSSTAGLTIYVNGTAVGTNASGTSHVLSTGSFDIGTRPGTGTQDFHGLIDDVAIFNGVLTQGELNTVIASGAAAVPEPGSLALLGLGGLLVARRQRG